jgi:glyoxylase-like metal-dependent hydrolase (beta-lactamase superfamily II)
MSRLQSIDVLHEGSPRVICCHRVGGDLIDPGPTASVHTLLDALADDVPERLLLTHIHLDHAGASGWLVRRWPQLEVWVSEIGAPHLVDPSKLIASASRLYGEDMDRLWGEIVPVPEENIRMLSGGEAIDGWRVAATPGHASHHVSFLREDEGWAFVGDAAGVRVVPGLITPPTPPPDIDLEAWQESLDVIESWDPSLLAITHFGAYEDVGEHIERLRIAIGAWSDLSRVTDGPAFAAALRAAMSSAASPELHRAIAGAMPPEQQWAGLDRYWRKRAEREAEAGTAGPSR